MAEFNTSATYNVQDRVTYNNKFYECLVDAPNTASTPNEGLYWVESYIYLNEVIQAPYVETISLINQVKNSTKEIIIQGYYFDSNIVVTIPDCTVNITNITPGIITMDVTASSITGAKTVQVTKNTVQAEGITPVLNIVDSITGNGAPGTFTTDFNAGGNGASSWGTDWTLEIFGNINSVAGYFTTSNSTTPSGTTGPNSSDDGTYYAFTEASNPNNGTGNYAYATTNNFAKIQKIEFDLHKYGAGHGDLTVEGYDGSTWNVLATYAGSYTTAQSDPFSHEVVNCSDLEQIRFNFCGTNPSTSYAADTAIDNIVITSI